MNARLFSFLGGLAEDNQAGKAAPEAASDRNARYGAPDGGGAAPTSSPTAPGAELRGTPLPSDTTGQAGGHDTTAPQGDTDGASAPSAEGGQTPAAGDEANPPEGAMDGVSQNTGVPTAEGGDGIDALAAAEIALGVTLALLVLGGGVLAYVGRKR